MACNLMIRSMLTTTKHVLRAQTFTNVQQIMSFSVCRGNLFQVDKSKFKFTDKHEWIQVNGNQGTIGITDYAQDKLGEVVYAELPKTGAQFNQAEQFCTLESVKAVSECYLPVSGKVVEVNESVAEQPNQINKSPFEQGWLVKIEITNQGELEKLMSETQYNEFLKSEQH